MKDKGKKEKTRVRQKETKAVALKEQDALSEYVVCERVCGCIGCVE